MDTNLLAAENDVQVSVYILCNIFLLTQTNNTLADEKYFICGGHSNVYVPIQLPSSYNGYDS